MEDRTAPALQHELDDTDLAPARQHELDDTDLP